MAPGVPGDRGNGDPRILEGAGDRGGGESHLPLLGLADRPGEQ